MKRSRRVVLTMMGTAAVGAVSMSLARAQPCGPGLETVPGQPDCRAIHGGFGGAGAHVHGHGSGHGHAGG